MPTLKGRHILFVMLYGQVKFPDHIINLVLIKLPHHEITRPGSLSIKSPIMSCRCCGSALWRHQHTHRHPHAYNLRRQRAVLTADPTSRQPAFSLTASTGHVAEVSHSFFSMAHAASAVAGSQVHSLFVKLASCQIERAEQKTWDVSASGSKSVLPFSLTVLQGFLFCGCSQTASSLPSSDGCLRACGLVISHLGVLLWQIPF